MWSVGASASHAPSKTSWPSRSIEASNPTSPGKRFTDSRGWVLESHNLSTGRKTDHLHLFVVSYHLQRRTSWLRRSTQPRIKPPVRAVLARGGVADKSGGWFWRSRNLFFHVVVFWTIVNLCYVHILAGAKVAIAKLWLSFLLVKLLQQKYQRKLSSFRYLL